MSEERRLRLRRAAAERARRRRHDEERQQVADGWRGYPREGDLPNGGSWDGDAPSFAVTTVTTNTSATYTSNMICPRCHSWPCACSRPSAS